MAKPSEEAALAAMALLMVRRKSEPPPIIVSTAEEWGRLTDEERERCDFGAGPLREDLVAMRARLPRSDGGFLIGVCFLDPDEYPADPTGPRNVVVKLDLPPVDYRKKPIPDEP